MFFKRAVIALSFGLGVSACGPKLPPQDSCNFVQNSQVQRVSWKNATPITMMIHESVPTKYHATILRAMAQWEYATGRTLFRVVGVKTGDLTPAKDGQNVIYWMKSWATARKTEQARTTIYWTDSVIEEADIYVNALNFEYSVTEPTGSEVDFESLILHELGHVLGLQHNQVNKSVMAEHLASGFERREPGDVDVESLKCEY